MIIKENVTVYKCGFCKKKKMFVKQAMERHEAKCSYNPDNNVACSGCSFLEEIEVEYTVFGHNGYYETEDVKKAKGFKCTKLDKILYPPKVFHSGLLERYPETFEGQERMPTQCEFYKDEYSDIFK